jgi:NAD(P)-dependent dehydrogenase (short-subunit alcohol dehydrogenase family)
MSRRSVVVTGGGRGVGRAVVERLLAQGDAVVVVELDAAALDWIPRTRCGLPGGRGGRGRRRRSGRQPGCGRGPAAGDADRLG